MTIHQPNSVIFSSMDQVIMLKEGQCLYHGAANQVKSYLEGHGFETPTDYSAADWAMEVLQSHSVDELISSGFIPSSDLARYDHSVANFTGRSSFSGPNSSFVRRHAAEGVTIATEISELARRLLCSFRNNPWPVLLKYLALFLLSGLVGVCLQGILSDGNTETDLNSKIGVIFVLGFNVFAVTILKVSEEGEARRLFVREHSSGTYRTISYVSFLVLWDLLDVFIMECCYILPTFWTIGVQGRFGYWMGVLYLFALVASATGSFVAAVAPASIDPHNFTPIPMTPQLLLSGFLVSYDSLPVFIRWLVWLQPLTYAFRLLLYEELLPCLDFSDDHQYQLDCFEAFKNGLPEDVGRWQEVYSADSVLTLPQAGEYIGQDAILEYLAYFSEGRNPLSGLWNFCGIQDSHILRLNSAGKGFCDVSFADVTQAQINERLVLNEQVWLKTVFGRRLRIEYPESKASFKVITENIFLPPAVVGHFSAVAQPLSVAASACTVLGSFCPAEFTANDFNDTLSCTEKMMSNLPLTTLNKSARKTYDGNSTSCRHLHASLAALNPKTHCPHVSFDPVEDPNGKVKCHESDNFLIEDYFATEDFTLFRETAEAHGLPSGSIDTGFFSPIEKSELSACGDSIIDPVAIGRVLPPGLACYNYITNTQGVTSDKIIPYVYALVGFWWTLRIVSSLLLRYRALQA